MKENRISLAHGSGGRLTQELLEKFVLANFKNPIVSGLDDSALLPRVSGRLAFTTDSFVVNPIFFPGGDIGKLSVFGTVNDLAMVGAEPRYLVCSLIIEEGFLFSDLGKIVISVKRAAAAAGVEVVGGDIKVVNKGGADKLFINTSGIGVVPGGVKIKSSSARPGDKIIVSGTLGEHGIAVLAARADFDFKCQIKSDCAPLAGLVKEMLGASRNIHVLRDPTRGGLATVLNEIASSSGVGIEVEEERIPVKKEVKAACELLGLDPLYIANEGKLVAFVKASDASRILAAMRKHRYGKDAAIIGEVLPGRPGRERGRVFLKTAIGGKRILDTLTGEELPRIC